MKAHYYNRIGCLLITREATCFRICPFSVFGHTFLPAPFSEEASKMKTSNTQLESNHIPPCHPHRLDLKSPSSLISVLTKAGQWVAIGKVFFFFFFQLRAISIIPGISIHMKIMHSHSLLVQTTAQPISDHLLFSCLLFNPWLYLLSYPTTEQTKQENNCGKSKCIEALDNDALPFPPHFLSYIGGKELLNRHV